MSCSYKIFQELKLEGDSFLYRLTLILFACRNIWIFGYALIVYDYQVSLYAELKIGNLAMI